LPSNGCLLVLRIRWNVFISQRAFCQESVSAGKCSSNRCLAVGLYVTIYPNLPGWTEESDGNINAGYSMSWTRFLTRTSRIHDSVCFYKVM
jgi:hypothetical protein